MSKLIRTGWLLLLGLGGCSGYAFRSNLSPDNFTDYFKTAGLSEITAADLNRAPYRSLGTVAGLACQETPSAYVATEADARNDARRRAADLGAAAIKFGRCVRLERTPACHVSVTCYAEAYLPASSQ